MLEGMNLDLAPVVDWTKGNQGLVSLAGWVLCGLIVLFKAGGRMLGVGKPDGGVATGLKESLESGTGWRWGKDGAAKSGSSVVLDRTDGSRLVANFKTGKYLIVKPDKKEVGLNAFMSRRERKACDAARTKVVARLKAADAVQARLDEQKANDAAAAELARFRGYRV